MKILKLIGFVVLFGCILSTNVWAINNQINQLQTQKKTMILNQLEENDLISTEIKKLGNEKNEVLSFLLDQDENGASQFYKTLSDPNKLYEAAWFLRYGKESFDALKNAYESEIAKLKKQDKPTVVRKPKPGDTNKEKNIHDLF